MFCVRIIATMVLMVLLALTYLLIYEENLASFMKQGFIIWHSFISTECWIRFIHKSARTDETEIMKHWCCLTLLGIFMGVCRYWTMTDEDLKKATVIGFTYYFVRLVMLVDRRDNSLDEENEGYENDEVANRVAYRQVILDLIQQLQDQQEFQETMN